VSPPLQVRVGFDEAPLTADKRVFVRVFRLSLTAQRGANAAVWALARPIAILDRRTEPATMKPVFDPALVVTAAALLIALLKLGGGGRKSARARSSEGG
jgi:hypothetical protein